MRKNRKHLPLYLLTAGFLVVLGLTVHIWYSYVRMIEQYDRVQDAENVSYDKHYAFISENTSSKLRNDIYVYAKEAAQKQNAYLEFFGDWDAGEYSMKDYLQIAIAARVDGIILEADGTNAVRELIKEADQAGIPVVTILNDDSRSNRKSYVGPNSYQMGTVYGQRILNCVDENTSSVLVLQRRELGGKEIAFKELKAAVREGLPSERRDEIRLNEKIIQTSNAFEAEEIIRDILIDPEQRPDILVCMNENDSESAYHAIIDYNLVGKVSIIGYYQTETMLDAIQKGTVSSVVTVDAHQIGELSVAALQEYCEMGYVSSYFSVDLSVADQSNIQEYIYEQK